MTGAFLTAAFLAGAFLADAFLTGPLIAADFVAADFLTTVLVAAAFLAGALLGILATDLAALPVLVALLEVFLPLGAFDAALAAPGRVDVVRVVAPARPVAARAAATARRSVLPVFLTVLAMTAPLGLAHPRSRMVPEG